MLPKGWDFAGVFGAQAEARALRLDALPDHVVQAINGRTASGAQDAQEEHLPLPQGATTWELLLAFGLALIAFGTALLARGSGLARHRPHAPRPVTRR